MTRICKVVVSMGVFLAGLAAHGQSLFEKWPYGSEITVHILGCQVRSNGFVVTSSGTGATYLVPNSDTNENSGWLSIATVRHNIIPPENVPRPDFLLVKMTPKIPTNRSVYVRIPLCTNATPNYWASEKGLDFAVIPLPPETGEKCSFPSFKESQVLTPTIVQSNGVAPGLLVSTTCHQPEYFEPLDLVIPTISPVMRIGHLSRLGWISLPDGTTITRPHVIDLHSSPGNSGATVVLNVITKESEVRAPFFLGVIQGYMEEQSSYVHYEAPVKVATTEGTVLTTGDGKETNRVAVAVKTKANPNLTSVTPVDELVGLRKSPKFLQVLATMISIRSQYSVEYGPEIKMTSNTH